MASSGSVFVCDKRGGICVDPWAVSNKIAAHGLAERTAQRYVRACLVTADLDPDAAEGRTMAEGIFGVAKSLRWQPAAGYARSAAERIGDLSEGELLQRWAAQQPDELTARLEGMLWLERNSNLSPRSPDFEARLGALLQAAVRAGWNTKTKQAAHDAAAKETQPMVNAISEQVARLAKEYEREHGLSFAVAMDKILAEDPALKAEYLSAPAAPTPTDPDSVRVLERMRQYQREHPGASAAEAYSAVLAGDPDLAKTYGRK